MVLVTGGAGLLGNELIRRLLLSGKKVRAIYNNTPVDIQDASLEQLPCSILDVVELEAVFKGVEEVYHCAGYVSFRGGETDKLYKINVEGTANMVNAALNEGIRKMVHVSSVAAMGKLWKEKPVTEQMFWTKETGNSMYAQSKYLGEMEVWRGIGEGLNAVIINPSIILGPGNWNEGSTAMFKTAYNEFPYYTGGITGFVDVRDVAEAMILLMQSDIEGERFILNVSNESFRSVFTRMARGFKKRPPHKNVLLWQSELVWRFHKLKGIFGSKHQLLSKETARAAFSKVYYDNSKLLKALPAFKYTSLDKTIADTCHLLQQKVNTQ